jgi:hypothetical protein
MTHSAGLITGPVEQIFGVNGQVRGTSQTYLSGIGLKVM